MAATSSFGNAAHNQKSINVECNLLSAWLSEQARMEHAIRTRLGLAGLAIVTGLVIGPSLVLSAMRQARVERASGQALASLGRELTQLRQACVAADPKLASEAMQTRSRDKADLFLGWSVDTMERTPKDAVITSLRVEMFGGELTIRMKAEATSATAARDDVESLARGKGVTTALLVSTRRSDTLSANGTSFEALRRVQIAP